MNREELEELLTELDDALVMFLRESKRGLL
jgi:hypothetical protein